LSGFNGAFGSSAVDWREEAIVKIVSKGFALSVGLIVGIVVGVATTDAASADPLVFEYHGWQVDLTGARGAESPAKMVAAVKRQLDIVEHVDLKPEVVQFMRTVKIWANPGNKKFGPGHYARATGVDLRVKELDAKKPIILHEFLHAYHDQKLPDGFANPDIARFFERGHGLWRDKAYMMTNRREFFAVTASVYLFGDIKRPPYSRARLRAKQPQYYQWLANLFDDGRPRT
jgi:hypothetical protein